MEGSRAFNYGDARLWVKRSRKVPSFSKLSEQRLETLDERLQEILREAIQHVDFSILCGHRTEEEQEEAYRTGHSTKQWPDSKHNTLPSIAVDVAPYVPGVQIDWKDLAAFARLAGYLQRIADEKGERYKLRWGGDWNENWWTAGRDTEEQFIDAGHIELVYTR